MTVPSHRPLRPGEVGPRLLVVMDGRPIGSLDSPSSREIKLTYTKEAPSVTRGLSCCLPVTSRRYSGRVVHNWISGLLPDRSEVLARWRAIYGPKRLDPYALLWHVGEDVAGAASFVRPERLDASQVSNALPLTEAEIGNRVGALVVDATAWAASAVGGQFSLAGAQAKFALARTANGWCLPSGGQPTTHIFKPAIPHMPDQDLNEHLTMCLAAAVGLPAAPTELKEFDGRRVLVVTRFDRLSNPDGTWRRIHQEDTVQARGLPPTSKYETNSGREVASIVNLLRAEVTGGRQEQDVATFIDAIAFNWLVLGTDAHARNYALLHTSSATRLAPLYDLNSYLPYAAGRRVSLAMKIGFSERNPSRVGGRDWVELADDCGLDPDGVLSRVRSLADRLAAVAESTIQAGSGDWESPLPATLVSGLLRHIEDCHERLSSV
jgi:serine/threonine-protein kinase HipA